MSTSPRDGRKRAIRLPKEAEGDGFPPEKDVSAPPEGTDQSKHADKKR